MQALWAFVWLLAKMFFLGDVATESRDTGYVIVEDGWVEALDGSDGPPPRP